MGLFDSVYHPCPHCGALVEFQSKEGECYLHVFAVDTAPPEILLDIMNKPNHCGKCDGWMALTDPAYPIGGIRPKPDLSASKVHSPSNPLTHQQGMKWWPHGLLFTKDDLLP